MSEARTALEILLKVTGEDAYLNLALKEGLKEHDSASAGRITHSVASAIEHMGYSDYLIAHYAKGRLHSSVRGILRLGVSELFYTNRPAPAVCSSCVDLVSEIGKDKLKGYVNGVLRSIIRDKEKGALPELPKDFAKRMSILTGYPEFLIKEYAEDHGEEFAEKLIMAGPAGTSVRPVGDTTAEELGEHLKERGFGYEKSRFVPSAFRLTSLAGSIADDDFFRSGKMTVQSEGAMLACECLDVHPGMRVLDACAAPGGKTAYIWDKMQRKGELTAWDVHPHRAELIGSTLKRLGMSGVKYGVKDAKAFELSLSESFDRILLDVPCSGLGGGSRPDARLRRTEKDLDELSELQYSILRACSSYLKRGGLLVYSTCTVSRRENKLAVERFLRENEDFAPDPFAELLPSEVRRRASGGMLQLYPNTDGTEGFFIARLRRN